MKKENLKEVLIYVGIIIFIVLLRTFIITPVRVNGTSMYPTLENKEIMILNKINYRFNDINRFDIIVIENGTEDLIKRVIGLPGETLEYIDNRLYINGKLVKENFLNNDVITDDFSIEDLGYETIPEGCYIALGDNRKDSLDSRYFGCFDRNRILGKASLVIFPFSKLGYKK